MARDYAQTDMMDLARRTQALFSPTGAALPQVEQLLRLQQEMAGQVETFARHWMERRQEAVETGLEALGEMHATRGTDPMAAMRAITDWQRGSFKRLNADMQDWVALCTQVAAIPARGTESSAAHEAADRPKTTNAKGRVARDAQSQHSTPV